MIEPLNADGELTEATLNSQLIVHQEGSRLVRRERADLDDTNIGWPDDDDSWGEEP